jgi:hypothetical protein
LLQPPLQVQDPTLLPLVLETVTGFLEGEDSPHQGIGVDDLNHEQHGDFMRVQLPALIEGLFEGEAISKSLTLWKKFMLGEKAADGEPLGAEAMKTLLLQVPTPPRDFYSLSPFQSRCLFRIFWRWRGTPKMPVGPQNCCRFLNRFVSVFHLNYVSVYHLNNKDVFLLKLILSNINKSQ